MGALLWRSSAFHVRERRRETPGWKAYVNITPLQTFGCIAIGLAFSFARVKHRPILLRGRSVKHRCGEGLERLRFVVRFLALNGSSSYTSFRDMVLSQ